MHLGTLDRVLLLLFAAGGAGFVNSIAGGGTMISYPALLLVGHSPVVANITNSLASLPGYLSGTYGYRRLLVEQRRDLRNVAPFAILGAILGTIILLTTPSSVFKGIVPFLIIMACLLLAYQGRLSDILEGMGFDKGGMRTLSILVFISSIYGSYFGAGLGIILLSTLTIFHHSDIQRNNALKISISSIIATTGDIIYLIVAHVAILDGLLMSIGFIVGGLLGAKAAMKIPADLLRRAIVIFGFIVAAILLAQNLHIKL
ncbi:MAG: sulfite exporter TauE/SafE family protein [Actinomycetota bacterium]|nr:sulfite exporter TauE/SafE family protein [Actinomycetota bacterium]